MGAPIVGILGGMGPEATVDLMRRVIAATPAEDDSDHVHLIVDQNPKVPSRIKALIEGTGESPAPTLAAMTRGLIAAGAGAVAMPCNTAHGYLDAIREAAGAVPVLDMVALTAERIAAMRPAPARVGLLASTALRITGLYGRALAAHGIETAFPRSQDAVMDAIRAVKRGDVGEGPRAAMRDAAAELIADGADVLLVACTELSALAEAPPRETRMLDAMDVLAEAIVAFAAKGDTPEAGRSGPPGTENDNETGRITHPSRETTA
jgi:aspartate racemase